MSSASQAHHQPTAPSAEHHHVKFNIQEEELKSHHENLEISNAGSENAFHVNLGYLKVDHSYKVVFSLTLAHPVEAKNIQLLSSRSSKHVTFKEVHRESSDKNVYTFTVYFYAYKEKSDKETIYFTTVANENGNQHKEGFHLPHIGGKDHHNSSHIVIHFEAKVLGQNQGTPFLRNGITLMHTHSSSSNPHLDEIEPDAAKSHFNIN